VQTLESFARRGRGGGDPLPATRQATGWTISAYHISSIIKQHQQVASKHVCCHEPCDNGPDSIRALKRVQQVSHLFTWLWTSKKISVCVMLLAAAVSR
jgi:hypothetical protein